MNVLNKEMNKTNRSYGCETWMLCNKGMDSLEMRKNIWGEKFLDEIKGCGVEGHVKK